MTLRDNAWSAAVEASMIVMGEGEIYPESEWHYGNKIHLHPVDEFCHWELIDISVHLEPENKKTIKRALKDMSEKGLLRRIEEHRREEEIHRGDDFVNTVPTSYTPSEKFESLVKFANRNPGSSE